MRMITMLILSLGIGIYVFGISQQIGYTQEVLHWKRILFLGVSFGLMEMLMLLFGVGLSVWIPTQRWLQEVVVIALILIGADMFRRAVWGKAPEERREELVSLQRLFVIALSAEIKTVLIGFCFAWEGRSPWVYAPMIWGVSTIVAVLGFTYGYHVGCRFWKALTGIGGIFLILASLGVYFHLI